MNKRADINTAILIGIVIIIGILIFVIIYKIGNVFK
jgi:hypothetical protein